MTDNKTESKTNVESTNPSTQQQHSLLETITATVANIGTEIVETIKNITGGGGEPDVSDQPIKERAKDLQEKLESGQPPAQPSLSEKVEGAIKATTEKVVSTSTAVTDKLGITTAKDDHSSGVSGKSIEDRAERLEHQLQTGNTPVDETLTGKMKETAQTVGEKIKNTAVAAKDKVADLPENIGLVRKDPSEKPFDKRVEILEERLTSGGNVPVEPTLGEKVQATVEKIKDTAVTTKDKVAGAVAAVPENIGLVRKDPSEKPFEARAQILEEKLTSVQPPTQPTLCEKVQGALEKVKDTATSITTRKDDHSSGVSDNSIEDRAEQLEHQLVK